MTVIKKLIRTVNNIFISIVLTLFYFFIIGLISIIYKLFRKNRAKTNSYWQDFSAKEPDLDFKSPY